MTVKVSQLVELLRLLALSADEQAKFLPAYVDVPDELAVLFGDQCDMIGVGELRDCLGDAAASVVQEMVGTFASMAGDDEFFSVDSFRHGPEWTSIRILSKRALDSAGLASLSPVMDWVRYVP